MKRKLSLFAAAAALAGSAFAQTEITIDRNEPIGTIEPEVYGQFLEHLGAQIYDGFWVGEDSDIPNTDGMRDDVFEALDNLDIPVIRWPGGCFADIYHWRDGIGDRTARANMAWGGTPEPNTFGTHEFFNLAERLGAKTYLNVNLATGTPQEAGDWLEYISSTGDTALANERRANGRDEPWKIDYVSIGNETWGCGGNMRPEYYADLYAQWATLLKTVGEQPKRVISGSHDGNVDYSDTVLDHRAMRGLSEGISVHFYTLPTRNWGDKGEGTDFGEDMWASTLNTTLRMDDIITEQLAMIDAHNMRDDFGLYVDEWGVWVNTPEGAPALWQQNTIREAIVAALNFNIFHQHADRVPMTNIAQMVNVLQSMILIEGEDMVKTPTYYAYEMYKPFQGATSLPVSMDSPVYSHGDYSFPAISASAGLTVDGSLVVALVNADASKAHDVSVPVGSGAKLSARVLTADSINAYNDFGKAETVKPKSVSVKANGGNVKMDLPPRSITVLIAGK